MLLTMALSIAGCILLFLTIRGAVVTMPTGLLIGYFPKDVQERLRPRIESLPMSFRRAAGWIILVLSAAAYIGLFIAGGIDGIRKGFSFSQFFLRFFIIGAVIKAFDIICLDYFLLTKTDFFQHYFPETDGCAGWKQFGYNRRQQIKHCILIPICCAVLALVFSRL